MVGTIIFLGLIAVIVIAIAVYLKSNNPYQVEDDASTIADDVIPDPIVEQMEDEAD